MALGQGFKTTMGIGKEAGVYGTAAPALATNMIPFESESLEKSFARIRSDILRGEAGRRVDVQGNQFVSGTIPVTVTYDSINSTWGRWFGTDLLLNLAMGAAAYSTHVVSLTFSNNSTEIFTLAMTKDVSVWQFQGGKIGDWRLMGNKTDPVKAEFDMTFYDLARGTTNINTAATLATLEGLFFAPAYIRHRDLTFRVGPSTATLSTSHNVRIDDWRLEVNQNFITDDYGSGSKRPLEPVKNGFREVAFSITVPRYENDNFANWSTNDTKLQADLTYINSTQQFIVEIPTLKISGFGAPVGGPDTVRQRVDFTCFMRSTGNTAMSAITDEFRIKTKNMRIAVP